MSRQRSMLPEPIWTRSHPQTVFLARHGQSEANVEERIAGQTNPGLTEKGIRQAQRLGAVLQGTRLTTILASCLKRSMDTARVTAESQGLVVCPLEAINEMSFGLLEGRLRRHLDDDSQSLLAQWTKNKSHFRIPGGESLLDVRSRLLPDLTQVFADNPGGTLLIVGHRQTNLVILSALLGWDLRSIADLPIQSKYVYEIQCGATPHVRTICLTGNARGKRVEGFLTGDGTMKYCATSSSFSESNRNGQ